VDRGNGEEFGYHVVVLYSLHYHRLLVAGLWPNSDTTVGSIIFLTEQMIHFPLGSIFSKKAPCSEVTLIAIVA